MSLPATLGVGTPLETASLSRLTPPSAFETHRRRRLAAWTTSHRLTSHARFATRVPHGQAGAAAGTSTPTRARRTDFRTHDAMHWGVDRGRRRRGLISRRSIVHDEEVVHEAGACWRGTKGGQLQWLNLRSCCDVSCVRFARRERPPLVDGCTGVTRTNYDHRLVPPNVDATCLKELTDAFRRADATLHGEGEGGAYRRDAEYAALLEWSTEALTRVERCVMPLLVEALRMDAAVAVTATHSLCIGEHGIRTGGGRRNVRVDRVGVQPRIGPA